MESASVEAAAAPVDAAAAPVEAAAAPVDAAAAPVDAAAAALKAALNAAALKAAAANQQQQQHASAATTTIVPSGTRGAHGEHIQHDIGVDTAASSASTRPIRRHKASGAAARMMASRRSSGMSGNNSTLLQQHKKKKKVSREKWDPMPILPLQRFMLYVEMKPYGINPLTEDWAWMSLGTFETEEACVAVQEELFKLDNRFEHFCIVLNGFEGDFPAPNSAAADKARYHNEFMQEYHTDHVRVQNEVREAMQLAAAEYKINPDGDRAGMFPMPTLNVDGAQVSEGVAHASDLDVLLGRYLALDVPNDEDASDDDDDDDEGEDTESSSSADDDDDVGGADKGEEFSPWQQQSGNVDGGADGDGLDMFVF